MTEEREIYRVEGRAEPRRETRLPFSSARYTAPTKDEFRSVTQTLGLTGSMVGSLLGVHPRTVRKWIGGETEIPYSAWRLLLIDAGLALEDPGEDLGAARRELAAVREGELPGIQYPTASIPSPASGRRIKDARGRKDR